FRAQHLGTETPTPVSLYLTWYIHAPLATQSEDILQWNHAQAGHRINRAADQRPIHVIFAGTQVGTCVPALLLRHRGLPPSQNRVVVMGSRVHHFCRRIGMRKVGMGADIPKAELEHRHAWNVDPFAESMDVRRNVAEVLREEG